MSTSETQGVPAPLNIGVSPSEEIPSFPLARAMATSLALAIAAAIAAWGVANRLRLGEVVNLHEFWGGSALSVSRVIRNGAIAYGSLGAILSAGLAVSGALAARRLSLTGLLPGLVFGFAVGACAGAASCYPLFPWYFANMEQTDFRVALLTHMGIWASIGGAAGASFGLGIGRRDVVVRALVGGITGAALATLLYEITGLFFPFAHTERPLAETALTRLAANLVLALCVAIGTVVVASQERRVTAKTANETIA